MVVGGNKKILCGREEGMCDCVLRERERVCAGLPMCGKRERGVCVCIGIRLRV